MDKSLSVSIHCDTLSFWCEALLHSFSQIIFQTSRSCGLLLLLAIALQSPTLLLGAVAGCALALLSAGLSGYEPERIRSGEFGFNGALIGLAFSALLGLSTATLALIALASLLSAPLMEWQGRCFRLAPYTSAFVLLTWSTWLLAPTDVSLAAAPFVAPQHIHTADGLVAASLHGLGQILFLGKPVPALLCLVALLVASARDAGWALAGALTGSLLAWSLSFPPDAVLSGLFGFNGALAAVALSKRFPHQPALILGGSVLATLLQPWLALGPLPPFTAPFVLACWSIALLTEAFEQIVRRRPG